MAAADGLPPDPPGDAARHRRHPRERAQRRAQAGKARPPGAREDPGGDRQARDRIRRVHERDHRDGRHRGQRGPPRMADFEREEEERPRRQHPKRERRRLVDLQHEPVDERAQVPRRHAGGQIAGRAPAGERPGERVGGHDGERRAERQEIPEGHDRIDARQLRHALEGGVQHGQRVAGVGGAVEERRDVRERERRRLSQPAHEPDMEEPVADDRRRDPPRQVGERRDGDPPRRRPRRHPPAAGRAAPHCRAKRMTAVAGEATAKTTARLCRAGQVAAASGGVRIPPSESAARPAPRRPGRGCSRGPRPEGRTTRGRAARAPPPPRRRARPIRARAARPEARGEGDHGGEVRRGGRSSRRHATDRCRSRSIAFQLFSAGPRRRSVHAVADPGRRRLSRLAADDRHALLGQRPRSGRRRQLCPPEVGRGRGRRLADADRLPGRADRGLEGEHPASRSRATSETSPRARSRPTSYANSSPTPSSTTASSRAPRGRCRASTMPSRPSTTTSSDR